MHTGEAARDEWFDDRAGLPGDEPGETSEGSFFALFVGVGFIGPLPSSEALCIHYSGIKTFSGNPNYIASIELFRIPVYTFSVE